MPTPLQNAFVRRFRNQVVVGKWNPRSTAELAFGGTCRAPDGRRRGSRDDVGGEEGGEEVVQVVRV